MNSIAVMMVGSTGLLTGQELGTRQAETWYFGRGVGLSFSGPGLPTPLYDGSLNTLDGSAVMSDRYSGRLLFYSDGSTVWNAEHRPMPNGTGLLGDESSGQPAMIVPDPGNPALYYVFTTSSNDRTDRTFRYSVVNMSLDGGSGDVVVKNVPLIDRGSEKVTATRHCDGRNYWVVTQEWGTNRFFAYPVTEAGIGEPVISALGESWPSGNDVQGTAQFSPDGSTLVVTSSGLRQLAFFDFDPFTGELTNYRVVASGKNYYGVEFSPDQSKLYSVTLPAGASDLVQFDLTAGDSAAVARSETVLYTQGGGWQGGQVQIGPDGALYVSFAYRRALGRIAYPDRAGLACEYTHDAIPLSSGSLSYGLPNFIDSDLPVVDAGARGLMVEVRPDTSTPFPGDEVSWEITVCNDGNRPVAPPDFRIALPATLTYLGGLSFFPLLSVGELQSGQCESVRFRTLLSDTVNPGESISLCISAADDTIPATLCLADLEYCGFITPRDEEEEDPCPVPTVLSTYTDSVSAEGSGDEVRMPLYYTGLPDGAVGPDDIEILCTYTFESSLLPIDDPKAFIDGTAVESWQIEIFDVVPGSFRLRLRRGGGVPITSADSLLLVLPITVYMPLADLAAETVITISPSTPDRCYSFDSTAGTVGFSVCGLDIRRIEALTSGRLALENPRFDNASDNLMLPFVLPIETGTSLSVHTIDGRLVTSSRRQVLPAGEHRLSLDDIHLAAGLYLVRLTTDIWTRARLFVVRR